MTFVAFCFGTLLAESTAAHLPDNYTVLLDNPDIRVLRAHYGPHEKVPVHEHPAYPTIFVYLNDSGIVRLTHVDGGKATTVDRPPTHTGAFRIAPARLERHSVENTGDVPADSVLVELRALPANAITAEFRGPAAAQPLLTATTKVFENPAIRIDRLICDPGTTCTLDAEPQSSVLVAVTPLALFGGSQGRMLNMQQPCSRLSPGQRAGVRSDGPVPAQLLRITLLSH